MKTLRAVLGVAIFSFICVRTASAQAQCSAPTYNEVYKQSQPFPPACPAGGPNASPYILLGVSLTGTGTWTCTSTANAVSPPGPNVVYFSYYEGNYTGSGGPQTGFGEMYCNTNNAPYTSYFCGPNVSPDATTATSPSDYNRFYNRAYSYTAENGTCPQSGYTQDFQQCSALACNPPPPPPPPPDPCCQCRMKGKPQNKGFAVLKSAKAPCCTCDCPLIIDTSGNGFDLTSAASGVRFDISGTGNPTQMAWTAPGSGDAFLCLPDSYGRCDDGKDLFGNYTPQPPSQTPNGYLALAVYDLPVNGGNGDGIIDSRDAIFSRLRLWVDRNHDGTSQPDEIYTLPALGVYSISLNYKEDRRTDQYGNLFRYRGQVNPGGPPDTVSRMMYDVFLLLGSNTITAQRSCPAVQQPRLLPEGKDGRLR